MERKNKRKKMNWPQFSKLKPTGKKSRWQTWGITALVTLLLYALLKVVATGEGFIGLWLKSLLETVEGIFIYLSRTILSPVGLVLIACIWLIKTGDLYRLLNKIRYMRLTKGDLPVVQHTAASSEAHMTEPAPLNAWQRSLLGEIERTSNIEEQKMGLSKLVIYEQLLEKPVTLPLLQFLHYYRRDDISFHQVAQFLVGEGLLEKDRLSGQELDIEAAVLGYMSYLQHAGLIEAHITLQPGADCFYGTIHKVKVPQRVLDVMELFSE